MENMLLIGYRTVTPLHAGGERGTGVVDLPVAREHHSAWPVIPSSTVKGNFRAKARDHRDKFSKEVEDRLFGPEGAETGGAIRFDEASVLLLPVRSLDQHFYWVTAPDALRRFGVALRRAGAKLPDSIPEPVQDHVMVAESTSGSLHLEDMCLRTQQTGLDSWVTALAKVAALTEEVLKRKLAVVTDDDFRVLCGFALPVSAHIKLDPALKVNKHSALWYEEDVSVDTVFYSVFGCLASADRNLKADDVATHLQTLLDADAGFTRFGGGETVGKGVCDVRAVSLS